MARIKKQGLAVKPKQSAITIASVRERINQDLKDLAIAMSGELDAHRATEALLLVRETDKILKNYDKVVKARVQELLLSEGEVVTDKGSRGMTVNGWSLFMKPTRTGVDPKKFEAMLRAKGLDPENFMDTSIVYSFNEQKALDAVAKKRITQEELASCKYDLSWTVETPKPAKNEE